MRISKSRVWSEASAVRWHQRLGFACPLRKEATRVDLPWAAWPVTKKTRQLSWRPSRAKSRCRKTISGTRGILYLPWVKAWALRLIHRLSHRLIRWAIPVQWWPFYPYRPSGKNGNNYRKVLSWKCRFLFPSSAEHFP